MDNHQLYSNGHGSIGLNEVMNSIKDFIPAFYFNLEEI